MDQTSEHSADLHFIFTLELSHFVSIKSLLVWLSWTLMFRSLFILFWFALCGTALVSIAINRSLNYSWWYQATFLFYRTCVLLIFVHLLLYFEEDVLSWSFCTLSGLLQFKLSDILDLIANNTVQLITNDQLNAWLLLAPHTMNAAAWLIGAIRKFGHILGYVWYHLSFWLPMRGSIEF